MHQGDYKSEILPLIFRSPWAQCGNKGGWVSQGPLDAGKIFMGEWSNLKVRYCFTE